MDANKILYCGCNLIEIKFEFDCVFIRHPCHLDYNSFIYRLHRQQSTQCIIYTLICKYIHIIVSIFCMEFLILYNVSENVSRVRILTYINIFQNPCLIEKQFRLTICSNKYKRNIFIKKKKYKRNKNLVGSCLMKQKLKSNIFHEYYRLEKYKNQLMN